jgi:hypothetical protein
VDDLFCQQLQLPEYRARYAGQSFYVFAELVNEWATLEVPSTPEPTIGMQRAAEYGISHVILEVNALSPFISWEAGSPCTFERLAQARIDWVRAHCPGPNNILINIRDFNDAWEEQPARMAAIVEYLARQPAEQRIMGVMLEDPTGAVFHFDMAVHVARTRALMDAAGWRDGHLLLHTHFAYGLAEAVVMEALAAGATGIWCGISREGAACGHANSLTTLTNLHRLGNAYVQERFNMPALRTAAIRMTQLTTGADPHPMTELYGARALDIVFDGAMGGENPMLEVLGVVPQVRITTMATEEMYGNKLTQCFGPGDWPAGLLKRMRERVFADLAAGRKEEYDSAPGFFTLYERCGGMVTPAITAAVAADTSLDHHAMIVALRAQCDEWGPDTGVPSLPSAKLAGGAAETPGSSMAGEGGFGARKAVRGASYQAFYDRFLAQFISCYSCDMADAAFAVLDVDGDGCISVRGLWGLVGLSA